MKKQVHRILAVLMAVLLMVSGLSVAVTAQEEEAALEILYGEENRTMSLVDTISTYDYIIYPYDNGETVTWTVGDADVLRIDEETYTIFPVAPGTTTLTGTTDTGLTDTVTVTVAAPAVWDGVGTKQLIFKEYGTCQLFSYTPLQTGAYTLYSEGTGDPYAELYDSTLSWIQSEDDNTAGYNFVLTMDLLAGETYYFKIGGYAPTITQVTLKQGVDTAFTSFDFALDSITLNVGDMFVPQWTYAPQSVAFYGCDIVSNDDTVVALTDYGLTAQGVGTTTLTATAEDGSVATMTVTVQDPVILMNNTTVDVDFSNGAMMRTYAIVVEETADYIIQSFDAPMTIVALTDSQGNDLQQTLAQGSLFMQETLTAGEVYVLCIIAAAEIEAPFEVALVKAGSMLKPTAVSLIFDDYSILKQQGNEIWVQMETYPYFDVVFEGEYGTMPEEYTITVGDEQILQYDEWGDVYCAAAGTTTLTVTAASGISNTYTVHVIEDLYGDLNVDGKVDIADAVQLFRYVNGRITVPDEEAVQYDINNDNCVDITDAVTMFRFVNGRIGTLS